MSQANHASTMRGVVRTAARQVEVVHLTRPRLEPGTAIVRVRASGICGSDLHMYRRGGERQDRPQGHEMAGGEAFATADDKSTRSVKVQFAL